MTRPKYFVDHDAYSDTLITIALPANTYERTSERVFLSNQQQTQERLAGAPSHRRDDRIKDVVKRIVPRHDGANDADRHELDARRLVRIQQARLAVSRARTQR